MHGKRGHQRTAEKGYTDDGALLSSWLSRAEVEKYAAWSLLQFENEQAEFERQPLDA